MLRAKTLKALRYHVVVRAGPILQKTKNRCGSKPSQLLLSTVRLVMLAQHVRQAATDVCNDGTTRSGSRHRNRLL